MNRAIIFGHITCIRVFEGWWHHICNQFLPRFSSICKKSVYLMLKGLFLWKFVSNSLDHVDKIWNGIWHITNKYQLWLVETELLFLNHILLVICLWRLGKKEPNIFDLGLVFDGHLVQRAIFQVSWWLSLRATSSWSENWAQVLSQTREPHLAHREPQTARWPELSSK